MYNKLLLICNEELEIEGINIILSQKYEIFYADTYDKALEILNEKYIDMVIFDYDSYINNNLDSLLRNYSNIVKIMLADEENQRIMKMIGKNICKACVVKPFERNIESIVDNTLNTMDYIKNLYFFTEFMNPKEIPMPNSSYIRIINLIDEDAEIDDIIEAIEQDPAMSVKILRVSNSAYYGIKTSSIKQALIYLGIANVRNLVISASVFDMFNTSAESEKFFQPLWQQAYLTNKIVRLIYKNRDKKMPETANLAGLLANVGEIFLLNEFKEKYIDLMEMLKSSSEDDEIDLESLENERFSANHSEIGGYLLDWWSLPYSIVETALYHHDPLNENIIDNELVCIVHVAEQYCSQALNIKNKYNYLEQCFKTLSIDEDFMNTIMEEVQ